MESTKLQKWALVAEVASAVAVVVTLLFLVAGMRENTNALQADTYQELMRDMNEWRESLRQSEVLAIIISEETDDAPLEDVEGIRLLSMQLWGIYEAAYFANKRGVLGDNEWIRFERMICRERSGRLSSTFWQSEYRGLLPITFALVPDFVDFVEELCD